MKLSETSYISTVEEDPYMDLRTILAKGGLISIIGSLVVRGTLILIHTIVARALGITSYGIYIFVLSLINIFQFLGMLGLNQGVVRFCAIYRSQQDYPRMRGIIWGSFGIAVVLSSFLSIILILFSKTVSINFLDSSEYSWIISFFAVSLPLFAINGIFEAFIQSLKKFFHQQIIIISRQLIILVLIWFLLFYGYGLLGVVVSSVSGLIFGATIGILLTISIAPYIFRIREIIFENYQLLRFSIPVFFSGFIYLLMNNIDSLMLGYLSTVEQVGIYGAASRIALLLTVILSAFLPIVSPIFAELYKNRRYDELIMTFQTVTRWIITLSLPYFIIVMLGSNEILGIFGEDFTSSIVLELLIIGQMINVATGPIGKLLEMSGKQDTTLIVLIIIVILNSLLNYFLIPIYGAVGASLSTSISIIFVFSVLAIFLHRIIGLKMYKFVVFKPIFIALIAMSVGFFLKLLLPINNIYGLMIQYSFTLIIYLYLILRFSIQNSDKKLIRNFQVKLLQYLS